MIYFMFYWLIAGLALYLGTPDTRLPTKPLKVLEFCFCMLAGGIMIPLAIFIKAIK